ncbi:MAG: hypothetical protein LBR60_04770 [Fibrobacter sp.]|nr:hypothetical protein [Fibrobacter sp.]
MKKAVLLFLVLATAMVLFSCATSTSRERILNLSGTTVSETEFGGVVRWYAVNTYGGAPGVRFQVGYFLDNEIGFVLYEGGTRGEEARFWRDGLHLRWDWKKYYSIIIEPDGTCLYYDFSAQSTAKARSVYKAYKF